MDQDDALEQQLRTTCSHPPPAPATDVRTAKRMRTIWKLLAANPVPAEPGEYLLVCRKGHDPYWYRLAGDTVCIGRRDDNDLALKHASVSGLHARIVPQEDGRELRDAASTNGTFVNSERVDERPLREGDAIQLGSFLLLYARRDAGDDGDSADNRTAELAPPE